jgi:[acyl-carrier-protein] S-malonyltransferase
VLRLNFSSFDSHARKGDPLAPIISDNIAESALAFRGYNVTNLGRTAELLAQPVYRQVVVAELERFGAICSEYSPRPVDLVKRVKSGQEPKLEEYQEAISLVVAVEMAQVRLLEELHGVEVSQAQLTFGYSLGELTAVCIGGMFSIDELIRVPLEVANDCVALATNTTMGVLFSRGPLIDEELVLRLCQQITGEGLGTIGISAVLSPNTMLLIGQNETVSRFKETMHDLLPQRAHLKLNPNSWPPMHTPIVRQKHITDRASVLMERVSGGTTPTCPPVFSLATGTMNYNDHSAREVLRKWADHPQRLWDAIDATLAAGVKTVIHVGPEPNVIPSTFRRLSENIRQQTTGASLGSLGMRAVSNLARRPWLAALLPGDASLLRAPHVRQVILEDWLLENVPAN